MAFGYEAMLFCVSSGIPGHLHARFSDFLVTNAHFFADIERGRLI